MNITSEQKKMAGIGAAVLLVAGAAFVYFDPLDLDLLGMNGGATVVKSAAAPAAKPDAAVPAAQPPAAAPKAAPAQASVPAVAPPAPPAKAAVPAPVTPTKAAAPAAPSKTAAPVVPAPAATPVVAAPAAQPAQAMQPPLKLANAIKTVKKSSQPMATNKPERAKNLDLRHCLELETNAAIAKCAGE